MIRTRRIRYNPIRILKLNVYCFENIRPRAELVYSTFCSIPIITLYPRR